MEELFDGLGVVLRRDLVAAGYDDNYLKRQVTSGRIVRLRQGAYARSSLWNEASSVDRHLLLSHAVMRQYDDRVALSHASANVKRGGPNYGLDLTSVHLTNLFGRGERRAAKIVHHRGACRVGDVTRLDGDWVTAPARTAVDTANDASRDAAVAVLDWYLNEGLATREEYDREFEVKDRWPDSLGLHRKLGLCDGKSESVGETRSRLLAHDERLPAPELQWEIFHPSGRLAGRVDFAWPGRKVMAEFDGVQKYLRLRRPGETIEQAILREKAREDQLRELTGWLMIRLVWADLDRPAATAQRIRRVMEMATR